MIKVHWQKRDLQYFRAILCDEIVGIFLYTFKNQNGKYQTKRLFRLNNLPNTRKLNGNSLLPLVEAKEMYACHYYSMKKLSPTTMEKLHLCKMNRSCNSQIISKKLSNNLCYENESSTKIA